MAKVSHTTQLLFDAITGRELDDVRKAIAAGADLTAHVDGRTALSYAQERCCADEIQKALLDAGADVRQTSHPLVCAVVAGRSDLVKELIAQGIDVNESARIGTPLKMAADRGRIEIVRRLIAANANLNGDFDTHGSPLQSAIVGGHTETACLLIHSGARISKDPSTTPLLHLAAELGHAKIVGALLKAGADPQATNVRGETPLEAAEAAAQESDRDYSAVIKLLRKANGGARTETAEQQLLAAAEGGDLKKIRTLLKTRVNLNPTDSRTSKFGMTPLTLAAAEGHLDVVEALLHAHADPNAGEIEPGHEEFLLDMIKWSGEENTAGYRLPNTPLAFAAQSGHAKIVKALLEAGAKPNTRNYAGTSALEFAAENGDAASVRALIDAGADVNQANEGKSTPLHKAAAGGFAEVVKLLLAVGAKSKRNKDKNLPADCAARAGHAEIVKVLSAVKKSKGSKPAKPPHPRQLVKAAGATHDVPMKGGGTRMEPLPEKQVLATVLALLESGANPNGVDDSGDTALMKAARYGHVNVAAALLAAGAEVNLRAKNGSTALYSAVVGGNPKLLIPLLLKHQADTNVPGYEGRTPLCYAALRRADAVELLLNHGANPNVRDNDGKTPLHILRLILQTSGYWSSVARTSMRPTIRALRFWGKPRRI